MAKTAFIGLGVMGYPMAGHLRAKGHEVTVFNRTAARAEAWVAQHKGQRGATPAEAAKGADFVFICVGNDHDVRSVALWADGRARGHAQGRGAGRPYDGLGRARPRDRREGRGARRRFPRCAGLRRAGRRREGPADGDGRRRAGRLRPRQAGDRLLCPGLRPAGRPWLGPARQDGQPDLHRRRSPGSGRGPELRRPGRARRRQADRDHLQGRGPELADGEPGVDHAGRQVRFRLRRGLDAQGSRHLPGRGQAQRRAAAGSPRWSTSSTPRSRRAAAHAGTPRA